MKDANAYFQLVHKEDGTYLRFYPATGGGISSLTYDMASGYLTKKKIFDFDSKMVGMAIRDLTEEVEIKISPATYYPEMETLDIIADPNRVKATGIFFAPSVGGKLLEKKDIVDELLHLGIRYGVIEKNIDDFLEKRNYCEEILLAEALLPVQGKNAVITYHFRTEGFGKPKVNEDGSVDFHHLDMINSVNAGDVLATLTPADYGKPGIDIFGTVIRPAKVNNKVLRHGLNIHLSEDKLTMYADVSGHVTLADDKVFVSDTYEVPADVSVASGDIDYDGNVLVRGNVVTGFTVKAKGDIIVEGAVEGATLLAGGQIILKRGIQGMGKGKLIAKGNITARFMENCEVSSDGDIFTDAIMHSKVTAKGEIVLTGKKSMITGGEVKSCRKITAKTLGSTMCTKTILKIGIDDAVMTEFKELETRLGQLAEEQNKYNNVFAIFKKKMEKGELSAEQKKQLIVAKQGFAQLKAESEKKETRYLSLKAEIENYRPGGVAFTGSVYPGVKVEISGVSFNVRDEVKYGRFIKERGDIRVTPI